jgi:anti-anti-sigma regulatory factor
MRGDRLGAARRPESTHDALATGCAVVVLRDDTLIDGLSQLRRGLDQLLARGQDTLVIDVSGLARLSSTTVARLLWVKRRCLARQVRVVIREPSRATVAMLRRTGLIGAIDVEGSHHASRGWPRSLRGSFSAQPGRLGGQP